MDQAKSSVGIGADLAKPGGARVREARRLFFSVIEGRNFGTRSLRRGMLRSPAYYCHAAITDVDSQALVQDFRTRRVTRESNETIVWGETFSYDFPEQYQELSKVEMRLTCYECSPIKDHFHGELRLPMAKLEGLIVDQWFALAGRDDKVSTNSGELHLRLEMGDNPIDACVARAHKYELKTSSVREKKKHRKSMDPHFTFQSPLVVSEPGLSLSPPRGDRFFHESAPYPTARGKSTRELLPLNGPSVHETIVEGTEKEKEKEKDKEKEKKKKRKSRVSITVSGPSEEGVTDVDGNRLDVGDGPPDGIRDGRFKQTLTDLARDKGKEKVPFDDGYLTDASVGTNNSGALGSPNLSAVSDWRDKKTKKMKGTMRDLRAEVFFRFPQEGDTLQRMPAVLTSQAHHYKWMIMFKNNIEDMTKDVVNWKDDTQLSKKELIDDLQKPEHYVFPCPRWNKSWRKKLQIAKDTRDRLVETIDTEMKDMEEHFEKVDKRATTRFATRETFSEEVQRLLYASSAIQLEDEQAKLLREGLEGNATSLTVAKMRDDDPVARLRREKELARNQVQQQEGKQPQDGDAEPVSSLTAALTSSPGQSPLASLSKTGFRMTNGRVMKPQQGGFLSSPAMMVLAVVFMLLLLNYIW